MFLPFFLLSQRGPASMLPHFAAAAAMAHHTACRRTRAATITTAVATVSPCLWAARRCGASSSSYVPFPSAAASHFPNGKGNFFAFFDIAKHPEVDAAALQKTYHNLQRRVHPDQQQVQAQEAREQQQRQRQAQEPPQPGCPEQHLQQLHISSTDTSTYANAAYETLRSPYSRCRYLSRLVKAQEMKGASLTPAEEEELMADDDRRTMQARQASPDKPMDDDFLLEMLRMNELIFGSNAESAEVQAQWNVLQADLEDRAVGYFQDAVKYWNSGDMAKFHHTVLEWTYVNNALQNLKERLLQVG